MSTVFLFANEAGDFNFTRQPKASKYYIICTVATTSCDVANDLLMLKRRLAWKGAPLRDYFHCSKDKQEIRDAVFETISHHDFTVQATIMEKSKAQPQVRPTDELWEHGEVHYY